MGALARAQEIITELEASGVRATLDPGLIAPPCVLLVPPSFTFGLACGADAAWRCPALAPATQIAEAGTWEALDNMASVASQVVDLSAVDLVAYTVNGRVYPAYLLSWQEPLTLGES